MNSGSGIQELMAAETRASQIVAEARIGQFQFSVGRGGFCRSIEAVPFGEGLVNGGVVFYVQLLVL
jgi:hypothetical protein